jgi:glutamine amidotransferase
MCRFLVYVSAAGARPMLLGDVLTKPTHSLVMQAFSGGSTPGFSAANNAVFNADGCGVAWWSLDGKRVFMFKTTSPAWSDKNLADIAAFVESHVIIGHVRAASRGSVVSFENTHPFRYGRLAFVHNGHIEGFGPLRRVFSTRLSEEAFSAVKGLTDSEHAFALLLTRLRDCGRAEPFAPAELVAAMRATIADILALLDEAGVVSGFTSLNLAISDGETVIVTRFCDRWPAIPPPSLYFAFPTSAELALEFGGGGGGEAAPSDGSASAAPSKAAAPAAVAAQEEGPVGGASDAYGGVDVALQRRDARWLRDEAFLAASRATARERTLLVASEPATAGAHVKWLTLPANAMLSYSRSGGGVPELTRLDSLLPAAGTGAGAMPSAASVEGGAVGIVGC